MLSIWIPGFDEYVSASEGLTEDEEQYLLDTLLTSTKKPKTQIPEGPSLFQDLVKRLEGFLTHSRWLLISAVRGAEGNITDLDTAGRIDRNSDIVRVKATYWQDGDSYD